jgi:hypothetical protein
MLLVIYLLLLTPPSLLLLLTLALLLLHQQLALWLVELQQLWASRIDQHKWLVEEKRLLLQGPQRMEVLIRDLRKLQRRLLGQLHYAMSAQLKLLQRLPSTGDGAEESAEAFPQFPAGFRVLPPPPVDQLCSFQELQQQTQQLQDRCKVLQQELVCSSYSGKALLQHHLYGVLQQHQQQLALLLVLLREFPQLQRQLLSSGALDPQQAVASLKK